MAQQLWRRYINMLGLAQTSLYSREQFFDFVKRRPDLKNISYNLENSSIPYLELLIQTLLGFPASKMFCENK